MGGQSVGVGHRIQENKAMNLQNYKYIVVCGKPQSGKDTVAEMLSFFLNRSYSSCSDVIYYDLAKTLGIEEWELRSIPKENLRHLLVAHGDHMTEENPSALVDGIILDLNSDILVGVRRVRELESLYEDYGDVVSIWVNRPDAPKIDDNTTINQHACDVIIDNDGTIEQLEQEVMELL